MLKRLEKVGDILSTVNPASNCQTEINTLLKSVESKLKADEKAQWQFKMKQYEDKIARKKKRCGNRKIQAQTRF